MRQSVYDRMVNPSWIRRWFMRQDDFTLWAIGLIWVIVQVSLILTFITFLLKLFI